MSENNVDISYFWDELYKNNETGWDLKSANPVFEVFSKYLELDYFTTNANSIKPRRGREVIQIYSK